MSIFSDLFNKSKNVKTVVGDTNTEIKKAILNINTPHYSYSINDGAQISALITCAKILAGDIARLPIKLYKTDKDGNKIILKDDPRYALLHDRPNSYQDSFSYRNALEFTRDIEGNSYAKINRDSTGFPISFDIIPEDEIGKIILVNGELWYEHKIENKESEPINGKDILHFKNLSMESNGFKGRDPKEDLNMNLSISFKALSVLNGFYDRGAIGNYVLETEIPEGVDANELSQLTDKFQEKYGSYLDSWELKITPPFTKLRNEAINFADAQLIETIKYNNGQVACYNGIPGHKLGILENTKFNSLVEVQNEYVTGVIAQIIEMYRRELEFKLLTQDEIKDGYSIEFETGALLITDSKTRIANYKDLFGMGSIGSEYIQKLENLPPVKEGENRYIATGFMGVDKANGKVTNAKDVSQ